ncbi:MAG: DUF6111 family protein [Maricaulaceae bacterium]
MLRITLVQLALLAAPFAAFFAYRAVMNWVWAHNLKQKEPPMQLLIIAGCILAVVGLAATAVFSNDRQDGALAPARLENGEIVPGRIETTQERHLSEERTAPAS